jgi:hypothetical protein
MFMRTFQLRFQYFVFGLKTSVFSHTICMSINQSINVSCNSYLEHRSCATELDVSNRISLISDEL